MFHRRRKYSCKLLSLITSKLWEFFFESGHWNKKNTANKDVARSFLCHCLFSFCKEKNYRSAFYFALTLGTSQIWNTVSSPEPFSSCQDLTKGTNSTHLVCNPRCNYKTITFNPLLNLGLKMIAHRVIIDRLPDVSWYAFWGMQGCT